MFDTMQLVIGIIFKAERQKCEITIHTPQCIERQPLSSSSQLLTISCSIKIS